VGAGRGRQSQGQDRRSGRPAQRSSGARSRRPAGARAGRRST
jgi:hypothetical protein